jgi:hypothetical protein
LAKGHHRCERDADQHRAGHTDSRYQPIRKQPGSPPQAPFVLGGNPLDDREVDRIVSVLDQGIGELGRTLSAA